MSVQAAIVHISIWIATAFTVGYVAMVTNDQTCFWSFVFPTLVSLSMICSKQ